MHPEGCARRVSLYYTEYYDLCDQNKKLDFWVQKSTSGIEPETADKSESRHEIKSINCKISDLVIRSVENINETSVEEFLENGEKLLIKKVFVSNGDDFEMRQELEIVRNNNTNSSSNNNDNDSINIDNNNNSSSSNNYNNSCSNNSNIDTSSSNNNNNNDSCSKSSSNNTVTPTSAEKRTITTASTTITTAAATTMAMTEATTIITTTATTMFNNQARCPWWLRPPAVRHP